MVHLQLWRPCLVQAEKNTRFLPFCPILPVQGLCRGGGGGGRSDHEAGRQDLHVLLLPSANILSASMDFLLEALVSQSVKQMETRSLAGIFYALQMEFLSSEFTSTCLVPPALYLFFLCDFR